MSSPTSIVAPYQLILPKKGWPREISLKAIDCHWDLQFYTAYTRQRLDEQVHAITLYLRDPSIDQITFLLKRWLKIKANLELTPWLVRLSHQFGLNYHSVSYRGQERRWGSCTQDGRICLNYKLLFLPPAYVDYVLIHELCHTVHFNHSINFWGLVSRFVPDWRKLRREVRCGDQFLPKWLLQRRK